MLRILWAIGAGLAIGVFRFEPPDFPRKQRELRFAWA